MQSVRFVFRTICPPLIKTVRTTCHPYGLSKANQSVQFVSVRFVHSPYDLSSVRFVCRPHCNALTMIWLFGCWRSIGFDQMCLKGIYPRGFHWQTLKRTKHVCFWKWSTKTFFSTYEIRVSHIFMLIGAGKRPTKMGEEVCWSDCIQPWRRQLHKTGNTELNTV